MRLSDCPFSKLDTNEPPRPVLPVVITTDIEVLHFDKSGKVDPGKVIHNIKGIEIDYMPNLDTILLGVTGFLETLTLHIDYPRQNFSIHV